MKGKGQVLGLFILLFLFSAAALAKPLTYMQVKVYYDNPEELTQLQSMHLDIIQTEENYINIVAFQSHLDEITLNGFETEIVHEDLVKFYQSRLDPTRTLGGYLTLSEIEAHVDQMIIDHPDIAQKVNIGLSLEGRMMWAVKISDNPEIDEDEPEVLITGMIHSSEVIGYVVSLAAMDSLTDGYGSNSRMTFLVDNREIWYIPIINVDGYYYNEVQYPSGGGVVRKNRRDNGDGTWGVDLNRNFGYMWGYDDVGSSPNGGDFTFRGTGPFSEPEAQNIRDFEIAHNFLLALHFHASLMCGIAWPWTYDESGTPEETTFGRIGTTLAALSGYGIYDMRVNGSEEDWEYAEQTLKDRCFPFLIETGQNFDDGMWPPLENLPFHLNNSVPMCHFIASAAGRLDLNFEEAPGLPVINVDEVVESAEYQVDWTLSEDPDNPLTGYELTEYLCNVGVLDEGGHLNGYENDIFIPSDINFHSSPESYYSQSLPNTIHYMQTVHPYKVQAGDILQFWTYYDIQNQYDYAYVDISTDGTSFTPIEGNITTNYNPNGLNRGNGITGESGDWIQGLFDLSDFEGQEIFVRFSFYTDNSIIREGIYIDDISPISFFDSETIITSVDYYTQHTFTEHPEGYYYYKLRAQDIDGQWGEYSEFSGTYVRPAFICGDANGDEDITILDVVYLINYKYKEGPAPEFLESADVNNDGNITILDAVYLINYKYKSGPDPACP